MKAFAVGLSGMTLLTLIAGCQPQLAEVELGDAEVQWNAIVSESYPGFRPPRTAPPAIQDKNTPLRSVVPTSENADSFSEEEAGAENAETEIPPAEDETEHPDFVETESDGVVNEPDAPEQEANPDAVSEGKEAMPGNSSAGNTTEYTEYVVQPGDSLSSIAKKFYNNGALFLRIYEANKDVIKDPNRLPLWLKIKIPRAN